MPTIKHYIIIPPRLLAALVDPLLISAPMKRFMEKSTKSIEDTAKSSAPVDRGRYRSSITSTVAFDGSSAEVGPAVNYSNIIEWGHRPGIWPNIDGLEGWARRHNFSNPRSGAYAIAWTHYRRGRQGLNIMGNALSSNIGKIHGFAGELLGEVASRFR